MCVDTVGTVMVLAIPEAKMWNIFKEKLSAAILSNSNFERRPCRPSDFRHVTAPCKLAYYFFDLW